MVSSRDLVIIAGQNAVGKSTAIPVVMEALKKQGVRCNEVPFAPYRTLLQLTQHDDTEGGHHHYHLWSPETDANHVQGHQHTDDAKETPIEPFVIVGNELPDNLVQKKFQILSALPTIENHVWVADMVGGVNTHPKDSILSSVDYSFQREAERLRAGLLPNAWLYRVRATFHIQMDEKTRSFLFDERSKEAYARAEAGKVAFLKPDEAKGFYGEDDFLALETLLVETGLTPFNVRTIANEATPNYFDQLQDTVTELFPRTGSVETPFNPRIGKER